VHACFLKLRTLRQQQRACVRDAAAYDSITAMKLRLTYFSNDGLSNDGHNFSVQKK
jgi:hypothetical protein